MSARTLGTIVVTGLVLFSPTSGFAEGGYFATKADERNGLLTPGAPPETAGTDTCAAPTAITSLPFNDTGTTVGATNTVGTIPIACNGNYTTVAGPDHIYTFTTDAVDANNLTFAVTTTDPSYDISIYILSTCNSGPSCVIGADNCFGQNAPGNPCGAVSDETIGPTSLAMGSTFFFYIDSFYAVGGTRDDGPYALSVTGMLPVELMEFSVD